MPYKQMLTATDCDPKVYATGDSLRNRSETALSGLTKRKHALLHKTSVGGTQQRIQRKRTRSIVSTCLRLPHSAGQQSLKGFNSTGACKLDVTMESVGTSVGGNIQITLHLKAGVLSTRNQALKHTILMFSWAREMPVKVTRRELDLLGHYETMAQRHPGPRVAPFGRSPPSAPCRGAAQRSSTVTSPDGGLMSVPCTEVPG